MLAISARIVAFLLVFIPLGATAAEYQDGFYVTALATIVDDDAKRQIGAEDEFNTIHFGMGVGFVNKNALQLVGSYTKFHDAGPETDQKQWGVSVDWKRRFGTSNVLIPYAVAGIGYLETRDEATKEEDSGLAASIGVGVLSPIKFMGLTFKAELRVRRDGSPAEGSYDEVLLSLGFEVPVKRFEKSVADADADGVLDANDRCGHTPPGANVDEYGCGRELDEDGDGVPDQRDMCGGSPPGSTVDRFGCVVGDSRVRSSA